MGGLGQGWLELSRVGQHWVVGVVVRSHMVDGVYGDVYPAPLPHVVQRWLGQRGCGGGQWG